MWLGGHGTGIVPVDLIPHSGRNGDRWSIFDVAGTILQVPLVRSTLLTNNMRWRPLAAVRRGGHVTARMCLQVFSHMVAFHVRPVVTAAQQA